VQVRHRLQSHELGGPGSVELPRVRCPTESAEAFGRLLATQILSLLQGSSPAYTFPSAFRPSFSAVGSVSETDSPFGRLFVVRCEGFTPSRWASEWMEISSDWSPVAGKSSLP
jgi:hypothetical protein